MTRFCCTTHHTSADRKRRQASAEAEQLSMLLLQWPKRSTLAIDLCVDASTNVVLPKSPLTLYPIPHALTSALIQPQCTYPDCVTCNVLGGDTCPTKKSNGCYTTAAYECTCEYPPSPPPGALSAANFFFSCGQIGGY